MGIAVAGSLALFAFANLDKFDSFKAAGFEAELRKVVTEATATIEHLRAVAAPLIEATIDVMATSGRWDGMGSEKQLQIFDSLEEVRTSLNINDSTLLNSQRVFLNYLAWDIVEKIWQEHFPGNNEIFPQIVSEIGRYNVKITPEVEKIIDFLKKHGIDIAKSKELNVLEDFLKKYKMNL